MCVSTTDDIVGNCTVQYSQDPSYEDLSALISRHINSSFTLFFAPSTKYYIQVVVSMDSGEVIVRTEYTFENGKKKVKLDKEV